MILSRTTVEDICIIVENEDIELYNDILRLLLNTTISKTRSSENLKNFCSWPRPQITCGILDHEFILNGISVCLLNDDILDVQADAIVNSTNALLDLNKGQLSKMILRRCGQNLVQECSRKRKVLNTHTPPNTHPHRGQVV
ncbi:uncharacterized protein LOC133194947 [Saccostrea echinata]|uniref:uncharacterized protein LOC133194947 n=1 Tax=Saccostrea echinata TaxID=191078 RepID=UPI002A7EAEE5|nr:uncharacterized protein LOC133194947 [Saccostrea echinata]